MLVLLLLPLIACSVGTTSCSSGFRDPITISSSSSFCIGSGVQNVLPDCNASALCPTVTPGSSCYSSTSNINAVCSFSTGLGAVACLSSSTEACYSQSGTPLGPAASGTVAASITSTSFFADGFTITAGIMSSSATGGSCTGFVPATGTGTSASCSISSSSTQACTLPSVALSTSAPQAGTQFAFQLTCTNSALSCHLISNAQAQTSGIQVCTRDAAATTTTAAQTTTTARTTTTAAPITTSGVAAVTTTTPATTTCCETCTGNSLFGTSFVCPILNGRSGCQISNTNGPVTCTCTATGQACPATVSSCNALCPVTTTSSTTTAPASGSSGSCFHEDTIISYKGAALNLMQLEKHAECAVPHVVSALGSVVTANCAGEPAVLRLTSGHLVYTQRGLQAAGDLTKDDVLYADLAEQRPCRIVSVTKEQSVQRYFGLNCYESQVLASGLKASTFEKLHSVPSFWMAIMGRILGIKQASALGDHIAELVAKLNLI